jgi:hypothetical protein
MFTGFQKGTVICGGEENGSPIVAAVDCVVEQIVSDWPRSTGHEDKVPAPRPARQKK